MSAVLLLLALGCPDRTYGGRAMEWAPPPSVVTYTRVDVSEPFDLPPKPMRMVWNGPAIVDDLLLYDVFTEDSSLGHPVVVERVRHFYGPAGYGYLGTLNAAGELERWDPPQVVLPPDAEVGRTWSGTHVKGTRTSERTCEILASELCGGGIVSVCDSALPGGHVILRDHFCPGVGWAGFEALIRRDDQPTVRMWSEGLVREGQSLPPTP